MMMMQTCGTTTSGRMSQPARPVNTLGRPSVKVSAVRATGVTVDDVKKADGGRMVVDVDGQKVLLAAVDDEVYAVSNKCSHMGISLVGKTKLLQGEVFDGCIRCPAHGTAFSLSSGEPQGEWCPNLPSLPIVGKIGAKRCALPTYAVTVENGGGVSVNI